MTSKDKLKMDLSQIWSSKEPIVYPDYSEDDIRLLEIRMEESGNFPSSFGHCKGWIETIRRKVKERHVVSTTLSMPLDLSRFALEDIERMERERAEARARDGKDVNNLEGDDLYRYGRALVEAECEVVLRWREEIGK